MPSSDAPPAGRTSRFPRVGASSSVAGASACAAPRTPIESSVAQQRAAGARHWAGRRPGGQMQDGARARAGAVTERPLRALRTLASVTSGFLYPWTPHFSFAVSGRYVLSIPLEPSNWDFLLHQCLLCISLQVHISMFATLGSGLFSLLHTSEKAVSGNSGIPA